MAKLVKIGGKSIETLAVEIGDKTYQIPLARSMKRKELLASAHTRIRVRAGLCLHGRGSVSRETPLRKRRKRSFYYIMIKASKG